VPIKSAGKFEYGQNKGTLSSCKASPLEKQPTGLFCQSQHCLKGRKQCTIALKIAIAIIKAPLKQGIFAHCGERLKALP